jgi:HPt (histidine-containing phosphotransfer) domain-containing protein
LVLRGPESGASLEKEQEPMVQAAAKTVDRTDTDPDATAPAIDRAHLAHMTFGDRNLERELLELFDRQAEMLLARMRAGDAAGVAALAHTLKGSAAGIGAGAVARAAEQTEHAAAGHAGDLAAALDRLAQAVTAARALIAELLRAH